MADTENTLTDPELILLRNNKESGVKYRERRHDQWTENYEFYRDQVQINRLIQRQSVNLPIMKQAIRSLLKDVDDMPVIHFENLDNNKDAEIFKNEYWKWTVEQNRMDIQDIIDKKQVFMFGRSFDQWQIMDGRVVQTIQDPMDILVSRYTDPSNIHTSRFLIHTHIILPLSVIEKNDQYDKEAVAKLKAWYGTQAGLVKSATNRKTLQEKNKKLQDLGVSDMSSPILGETYVELSQHFVVRDDGQIWLYVECDDMYILLRKPLEEVIGTTKDHFWKTHYPYVSWADDVERQDFWSDGIADIIRTPNKVLNAWYSQIVENRTLRNMGMNFYDAKVASGEGWMPPSNVEPTPGGWIPLPGKPSEVYQKVDVPDLSESMDEVKFVIDMLERATGSTATQQGAQTERKITLGEVQLALGEAKERVKGMSKFYTQAWKDRGLIFEKLIEAAGDRLDAVKINKKGKNSNDIYTREIGPGDWKTASGYNVRVWSRDEKDKENTTQLERLNVAKQIMPDNPKFDDTYKRKILEFTGLSPDEINDIMEFEKKKQDMFASGMTVPVMNQQPPKPAPVRPQ